MQIVINIPERIYLNAKADKLCGSNILVNAIKNGITLPKGHGRLIDADEFHHTLEDMPVRDNDKWFNWLQKACNRLAEAPTIIEVDKSEEE